VTESPQFALLLMGAFGLRHCGEPSGMAIRSKKARAVIAYVAMQEPMRISRERLATLFWPDRTDKMARQNLRACIASLRRDLGWLADAVLIADDEAVELRDVAVDACQLLGIAETGETARFEQAAGLYRGPFLADLTLDNEAFGEWVLAERAKLDAAAGAILAKLASRADEASDGAKALEFSSRLTAIDPFREDWLRLGLAISARHLGRDKALLQARSFFALLKKELDVAPDAATIELVDRLKAEGMPSGNRTVRAGDDSGGRVRLSFSKHHTVPPPQPAVHRGRRPLIAAVVAAAAVFAACLAAIYGPDIRGTLPWTGPAARAVGDSSAIPLVVSPFEAEAADTDDLSRALTQEVLADLSRFSGLKVFDGRALPVERSGSKFMASGSLRRQGQDVRIRVALTDTADQTLVWTDDYVASDENIADLSGKAARRIARGLQVRATYALARNLDAGQLDLAPLNQLIAKALTIQYRTPAAADEAAATALYDEILRRDRDNPLALTGLAARLVIASVNLLSVQKPALARAERLVRQALRIDPRIERAHYWLGIVYRMSGQRELALQSFERALKLNPSFVAAEAGAGFTLVLSGRAGEGLRRIENALAESSHDPAERQGLTFAGIARLELGDDQAAIRSLQQAASLGIPPPPLHAALASAYALAGERTKSQEQFRLMKQAADPAAVEQLLARAAKSGDGHGLRYLQGLHLAANDTL
jgi:DNA-binding SARP family transcriptional activator/TolB-like protein/Tfp pilus assembly protein PilF